MTSPLGVPAANAREVQSASAFEFIGILLSMLPSVNLPCAALFRALAPQARRPAGTHRCGVGSGLDRLAAEFRAIAVP